LNGLIPTRRIGGGSMRSSLSNVVTRLLVGVSMTAVLLAGCGSKKPDLAIYDVGYSLVQATDPLRDVMWDAYLRSMGLSETAVKEWTEKVRRSHEEDSYKWGYWVQFYIKNRGDKDAFRIPIKLVLPPNTTKTFPPFTDKDWEQSLNWDEFYFTGDDVQLDYLKSGEVRRITYCLCSGKFRQKPSPEILDKLKGTTIEIGSFKSEP
jgi:hypothetical protein